LLIWNKNDLKLNHELHQICIWRNTQFWFDFWPLGWGRGRGIPNVIAKKKGTRTSLFSLQFSQEEGLTVNMKKVKYDFTL